MNKILTTNDILALTGNGGEFFSIGFHKRPKKLGKRAMARGELQPTKGELRVFPSCRYGVKKDLKGGKPAYDREANNILCVWVLKEGLNAEDQAVLADERNGDYRSIPCENVTFVNAKKGKWMVQDGILVEAISA